MAKSREKPSTKARREGYAQLHKLKRLLVKLLYPKMLYKEYFIDDDHHFVDEFNKPGWRDYMVKHVPELKRGGVAQPKSSKKRRSKMKDRKSTIR